MYIIKLEGWDLRLCVRACLIRTDEAQPYAGQDGAIAWRLESVPGSAGKWVTVDATRDLQVFDIWTGPRVDEDSIVAKTRALEVRTKVSLVRTASETWEEDRATSHSTGAAVN